MPPTKQFPAGKIHPTDEGELSMKIGTRDGAVVIDFGTPTAWVGFYPAQARELAERLIAHAAQLERERH